MKVNQVTFAAALGRVGKKVLSSALSLSCSSSISLSIEVWLVQEKLLPFVRVRKSECCPKLTGISESFLGITERRKIGRLGSSRKEKVLERMKVYLDVPTRTIFKGCGIINSFHINARCS